MSLDTFLSIACMVGAVIAYGGYRYFSENVSLRYARDKKRGRPGAGTSKGGKRKFAQC